jgi:hypothetical protein
MGIKGNLPESYITPKTLVFEEMRLSWNYSWLNLAYAFTPPLGLPDF